MTKQSDLNYQAGARRWSLIVAVGGAGLIAICIAFLRESIWDRFLKYHFGQIAVVIVDDYDPRREGEGPNGQRLRVLTREGKIKWEIRGLNKSLALCARNGLALDPKRSRIYVQERGGGGRILALDSRGNVLFTLEHGASSAVSVDPVTGEIWCLCDGELTSETVVYSLNGERIASHQLCGEDIKYNRCDRSFWIVGNQIFKIDTSGRVLARGVPPAWKWTSVAPDHRDGSVWVVGGSPDVIRLDKDGELRLDVDITGAPPFSVACDPKTGTAWVVEADQESTNCVYRISVEGQILQSPSLNGQCVAISERMGIVWLATEEKIIAADANGKILNEHAFDFPSIMVVWMAAP